MESGNACKKMESKLYPENSFTALRYSAAFQPNIIIVHIRAKKVKIESKSSQRVYNKLPPFS